MGEGDQIMYWSPSIVFLPENDRVLYSLGDYYFYL